MSLRKRLKKWFKAQREIRIKRKSESRLKNLDGKLALLAIMKNEAHVLDEWIDHYISQGVDHIILIDNGSTDESVKIAKESKHSKQITLLKKLQMWSQVKHYQKSIKEKRLLNRFEWIVVADLDEFWFVKDGRRLVDKLDDYHNVDLIYTQWTIFGSSGHIKQPEDVRRSFTSCWPYLGEHYNTKWIIRTSGIPSEKGIFPHRVSNASSARTHVDNIDLQLNHYVLQSKEWFEKVKMQRGNVATDQSSDKETWAYFNHIDKQCTAKNTLIIDKVLDNKLRR